jgi:hypothetical protein
VGSRGWYGCVGVSQSHRGLATGEVVVGGHRWPSADVGEEDDARGHVVRERKKGEGGSWAGRSVGSGKGRARARLVGRASGWAKRREGEGCRPGVKFFVFLFFLKMLNSNKFVYFVVNCL